MILYRHAKVNIVLKPNSLLVNIATPTMFFLPCTENYSIDNLI